MLRYIKRKVNETREENGGGEGTAAPTTVSDSHPINNNGNNSHHISYDTAANTAGGVARNLSNKLRNRVNSNGNNNNNHTLESLAEQQRQLEMAVLAPLSHLAKFDACIGAADALAASSSSSPLPLGSSDEKANSKNVVADCSVLVSPDGDLLLMPQQNSNNNNSSSALSTELGDDYEAAVHVGNDFCLEAEAAVTTNTAGSGGGDAHKNGFTANGWSIPAASLALRQTEQSLHDFADFCEEIVLSKKEAAARSSVACDKLLRPACGDQDSDTNGSGYPGVYYPVDLQQDAELMKQTTSGSASNSVVAFDMVQGRVGPMRFQGGTLHAAHVALESFYYRMSQCESNRWRLASFQPLQAYGSSGGSNSQGLPALRKAATKAEERSSNRQKTLREIYGRVKLIEAHLAACQQFANAKWEEVQSAEERVTKLIEERTLERSRKREKQRLQDFHQAGAQQQEQQQQNQLGANKEEIWNLVSQVSESMENGSFEPINFPQQQLTGDPSATSQAPQLPPPPLEELPPLSRFDIEDEVGLQDYRMAAMAADRAVQDASGSLLNVLSSLDQVRRSARISAETNLLSSCQAQAACIRSIVKLERAAAEERLEHIEKLEKYADSIDVRSDLNIYIHADRKRAGGSAPLGQDDDGGIASALAVLTSHQEGNMGTGTPSTLYNSSTKNGEQQNQGKESIAEHVSSEALEEALEALFSNGELLRPEAADSEKQKQAQAKFNSAVKLLCDLGEEKSLAARPKRSRMCYALNAKRASHTEIKSPIQFDGLCKVFISILNGCDCESGGVSNAKMCMMLSQSFYLSEKYNGGEENEEERSKRLYIKNRLIGHPLWNHEEFWDLVLFQCLSESLTNSGVMTNFERLSASETKKSEWKESRKLQWFDLTPAERIEAASQVHAVVTAQLGAISHSMIEFGCNLERACAFVRRMAIRNQLPLSQRAVLLQHLVELKHDNDSERVESQHELGMPFSKNEGEVNQYLESDEKILEANPAVPDAAGGAGQDAEKTPQSSEELHTSNDQTSLGTIESGAEEVKSGATGDAADHINTVKQSEDEQPEEKKYIDDEPVAEHGEDAPTPNEEGDNAGAIHEDGNTLAEISKKD